MLSLGGRAGAMRARREGRASRLLSAPGHAILGIMRLADSSETAGAETRPLRPRIAGLYVVLVGANVLAWVWALIAFRHSPALLGSAFLAYTFGLRHALDADHIAAIDNVTRSLMQDGQRPISAGLYFSLGHSTVVVALSLAIAGAASALEGRLSSLRAVGGAIGTIVSSVFLLAIGLANLVILVQVFRTFQRVRGGGALLERDLDLVPASAGPVGRALRRLFRVVRRSWQMYPLGLLFGLGFDTATEIGLLAISATQAGHGVPVWSILVFPALFTAGMTLVDTTDSVLMVGAYGWAFVKPIRKLYYNMTITAVSVVVALLVGGIEALGLAVRELGLSGGVWGAIGGLDDHVGALGVIILGVFAASWLVSVAIYRAKRYDEIEITSA